MTEEEIKYFKEYVCASFFWSLFPKQKENSRDNKAQQLEQYREYFKKQIDLFNEYGAITRLMRESTRKLVQEFQAAYSALEKSMPEETHQQPGKTGQDRCPREAAVEIIRVLERYHGDRKGREWLKDFLKPGGELDQFLKRHSTNFEFSFDIPRPSTSDAKDWGTQMKDRLLRGLVVNDDQPRVKHWTDELVQKREALLKDISSGSTPPLYFPRAGKESDKKQ